MLEEASRLIDEICQIKNQYVNEVGSGRRVWPRSIKERMTKLDKLGLPAKGVSARTGIPYCTILLWRHRRQKASPDGGAFHEVTVESKLPAISKSPAVTAPKFEMPKAENLRLTTPEGYVIDGLDAGGIISIMAAVSKAGRHAS
jgi:hypothetical protein